MTTLLWIICSCAVGGALSVAAAAAVALRVHPSHVPILISYAVGALLGAVFLEILPHAFEAVASPKTVGATVLGGILAFFILENWSCGGISTCRNGASTSVWVNWIRMLRITATSRLQRMPVTMTMVAAA